MPLLRGSDARRRVLKTPQGVIDRSCLAQAARATPRRSRTGCLYCAAPSNEPQRRLGDADNALQASALAENMSESAARDGDVVGQVVEVIADRSSSSNRIVDIIGAIERIAFQTNFQWLAVQQSQGNRNERLPSTACRLARG